MMGPRQKAQAALFYEFSLEDQVPQDHLLRSIDRFVDLNGIAISLQVDHFSGGTPLTGGAWQPSGLSVPEARLC